MDRLDNNPSIPVDWSTNNKSILLKHAEDTLAKFTHNDPKKAHKLFTLISQAIPSHKEIGYNVGGAVAAVHTTEASNWVIGRIAQRAFNMEAKEDWNSWLVSALFSPFTSRGGLSSNFMPVLSVFGTVVGGVTIPTALAFANLLYDNYFPDKQFELKDIPKLSDVYKVTEDGQIVTREGKKLSSRDIADIKKDIATLDIIYRLLNSDPVKLEKDFIIKREDGAFVYLDGEVIPKNKIKEGKSSVSTELKALERLSGENPQKRDKAIAKFIKHLAEHTPHYEKGQYPLFIKCSDGKQCTPWGEIVTPKYRALLEKKMEEDEKVLLNAKNKQEVTAAVLKIQTDLQGLVKQVP